ncbi:MAG: hypothetical protein JSW05_00030 [Candidatus Thorarchaeota archaeon]|nr:MAG: hypothetical protein JSW05_00030 [Candidatus Thorarchaeota archaeon]
MHTLLQIAEFFGLLIWLFVMFSWVIIIVIAWVWYYYEKRSSKKPKRPKGSPPLFTVVSRLRVGFDSVHVRDKIEAPDSQQAVNEARRKHPNALDVWVETVE